MYNDFVGENYDAKLTTKEIGKKVKEYAKKNFKGLKIGVRTTYNSINVTIKNGENFRAKTFQELSQDDERRLTLKILKKNNGGLLREKLEEIGNEFLKKEFFFNKQILEIQKNIEIFLNSFNKDESSVMTDYFYQNFYGFVNIEN